MASSNFTDIATQFTEFYYSQFDRDRKQLSQLYRETSMLTFESTSTLGATAIVEKLSELPFTQVKHAVTTLDAQPSNNGSIVILVTGQLLVDEEQRPMSYSQAFLLQPDGGSFFIMNDIFKLVYP